MHPGGREAAVHRHSLDRLNAINDSLKKKEHPGPLKILVGCEFRQMEPGFPVIMQVVHIRSEVLFQDGIAALGLSVSLWVERGSVGVLRS